MAKLSRKTKLKSFPFHKCYCGITVSQESNWKACISDRRHQTECFVSRYHPMYFAILFIVIISGNGVFAAHRESFKIKYPNILSNNVNVIPQDINESGARYDNSVGNGSTNRNKNNSGSNIKIHSSSEETSSITLESNNEYTSSTSPHSSTEGAFNSSIKSFIRSTNRLQKNTKYIVGMSPGVNSNGNEISDDMSNGPYFDKNASKNITALLGKTAYLNCRVKNLGNRTMLLQVSWVRHRDIHLLTVGRYTYTSDQRFRAIHQPQTDDWILQIKYPQHRDSGIYECQVSTTPHMSHYIHLNVVEPSTEIIGAPDMYIENGSTINLTCIILNSPEPPAYIFWNHNSAIINYDSQRGGVSVVTNKGDTTTSFLLIKSARPSDSGHYQCNPSNAKSKSVTVHVLNGEFPAAMQRGVRTSLLMSRNHYLLVFLLVYSFTLAYVEQHFMPVQIFMFGIGYGKLDMYKNSFSN